MVIISVVVATFHTNSINFCFHYSTSSPLYNGTRTQRFNKKQVRYSGPMYDMREKNSDKYQQLVHIVLQI